MIFRRLLRILFAFVLLFTSIQGAQAAGWDDRFGPPGVNGGGWFSDYFAQVPFSFDDTQVFATAIGGDYLYVGGAFTSAGGTPANYIARWHKTTGEWEALGAGVNDAVTAIIVQGNTVYVGGRFSKAGAVDAIHVAQWNITTQSWSALGSGLGDPSVIGERVTELLWQDDLLYAGGIFVKAGATTVNHVAAWNGTSWQALGNGIQGDVRALARASAGGIYAGGFFDMAGAVAANGIAQWNGSSWQALGSGVSGGDRFVSTILEEGDRVYIGGDFSAAGGIAAANLAQWDGAQWSAVGGGVNTIFGVNALAWWNNSLVVGGSFQEAGGLPFRNIARWDGTQWLALGKGTVGNVSTLAVDGSQFYAGGFLRVAGDFVSNKIARWNGSAWEPLGQGSQQGGPENVVTSVTPLDAQGNEVVIGGFFAEIGEEPDPFNPSGGDRFRSLGRWDGTSWQPLGDFGLSSAYWFVNEVVAAGDDVYIGGYFRKLDEDFSAQAIVRWNRQSNQWGALDIGVGRPDEDAEIQVNAIAVDSANEVYAGGVFTFAGGQTVNNVALWNGTSWQALGGGLTGGAQPKVEVLALHDNLLYAGGDFTQSGAGVINNLAVWNGTAWAAVDPTFQGQVYALAFLGDDLLVGGTFTAQGLPDPTRLARWNGQSWALLGGTDLNEAGHPDFLPAVYDIVVRGEEVFVGGNFVRAGAEVVNGVARWNGNSWDGLDGGVAGGGPVYGAFVQDLAVAGESLYVGGNFTAAGGKPSAYFARYDLSGAAQGDEALFLPLVGP